ncbi:hypothetical protein [Robertmurraya andreesenii]|uniref:Uncharacterized protein n=1 Tax=Anoxybacillus andreesenii TaxID=1325932 RepID=A0ABT9V204_9BACL|nr:hypothetical protein [Robertmurraya andreesenii]MDQ0154964.1 hypothetical protein [Robertmurraya andreesenii]
MTQFESGSDALNSLNATNEGGGGGNKAEFASFKSGTTYKVRVLGKADLIRFYSYGIYKKVNSFVAKNPSVKNAKGFPTDNLTPWDKAFQYYQDLKFKARDEGNAAAEEEYGDLAYQFKPKERYALGFIDLTTGEPIIVDLSKKQAQTIHAVIKKFEKKLGKVAFELAKQGSGQSTTVSLTPFIDMDDDLTDKERENFAKLDGKEFDMALFDGLLYEADEKEQIESLVAAGFDVSLIGLSLGGQTQADAADPTTQF